MAIAESGAASAATPDNTLVIELATGNVVIEMLPDVAPKHVARIKELAHDHFYDGIVFHRVIPGFMAQTGDPTGTGTGGSQARQPAGRVLEEAVRARHGRDGPLGRTRTAPTASSSSASTGRPALNGQYTVWGKVVAGHGPRRQDREGRAAGASPTR